MRLIDAGELERNIDELSKDAGFYRAIYEWFSRRIKDAPTIDAVPVTHAELNHLINDTIAYIWGLEDRGCDKPEFGYDSRKALLEKLKQFEKEHFPEMECGCSG